MIETHCPGNTALVMPLGVYIGLAAVALNFVVARGLGASLGFLALVKFASLVIAITACEFGLTRTSSPPAS